MTALNPSLPLTAVNGKLSPTCFTSYEFNEIYYTYPPHLVLWDHLLPGGGAGGGLEEGVGVDPPLGVDEDVVGAGDGQGHAEWVRSGQVIQQLW